MEDIRTWAISLCTVAIGCAAVQMLAPKGGMGRLLNMVLAAFFLCALITPLFSLSLPFSDADLSLGTGDEAALTQRFYDRLCAETDTAMTKRVTDILASYDITVERVETDMHITQNGDIYMRRITVYLDEQNIRQATTVRTVLSQQLDIPVSIQET